MIWAFALIPFISLLNHLGGQSVRIPDSRVMCRVIIIPIAIFIVSLLCDVPIESSMLIEAISIPAFALWAIPAWGEMFMAINGTDFRDYSKYKWIATFCDFICGTSHLTPLTSAQAREWGMIYGTVRGMFLYPLFIGLASVLTPWALIVGLFCLMQGIVYRFCGLVLYAEYVFGAVIGGAIAAILIISQL